GVGPVVVAQGVERVLDRAARLAVGSLERALEQDRALGQLAGEVLVEVGLDLAPQLVVPCGPGVRPRLDRGLPAADRLDAEGAAAAHAREVGVERGHRRLEPAGPAGRLVLDDGAQLLVAVAEDVGLDGDTVADGALWRVPAAVDDGGRMRDPDAPRRFVA